MKVLILLFFLSLTFLSSGKLVHTCIHDEIAEEIEPVHMDVPSHRGLQSQSPRPYQISFDYSGLASMNINTRRFIEKTLLVAKTFFADLI